MGRGIEFYDYSKLDKNAWRSYYNDAQQISQNDVFKNEINHYIADLVKFISYEAATFDQVLHTRTAIVTLETLMIRLQSIENPNKERRPIDEFEPI